MKYKILLGCGVSLVMLAAVFSSSLVYSHIATAPSRQTLPQSSPQSSPEALPDSIPNSIPDSIRIKAVGDMVPGTNFPDRRLPANPNQLFPNSIREKLQGADILFGNFESTITNHPHTTKDISRGQVFAFRSPPKYAKLFAEVGFDVLSVANNHARDFGTVGFQDTINNITAAGMQAVGEKIKFSI